MAKIVWDGMDGAVAQSKTKARGRLQPINAVESVNRLMIGDNLEVLRYLRDTEGSSVDAIYIDPPYNTGSSFIYNDRRGSDAWLSFMYPRIVLGRDMLKDDGVMMISIDDNEIHKLRMICDDIFHTKNYISEIIWEKKNGGGMSNRFFLRTHEYVLVYAKNREAIDNNFIVPISESGEDQYKNIDGDPRGDYALFPGAMTIGEDSDNPDRVYELESPLGIKVKRRWRFGREEYENLVEDNRIIWSDRGRGLPYYKKYRSERERETVGGTQIVTRPTSIISGGETQNRRARAEWVELGLCEPPTFSKPKLYFDYPKPTAFLKRLLSLIDKKDAHVMDFFGGSGSTAHAVWDLNANDHGARRWTLVQLPEPIPEDHAAYRAGYKHIHEVCRERLSRVAKEDDLSLFSTMREYDMQWQEYEYVETQPAINMPEVVEGNELPF